MQPARHQPRRCRQHGCGRDVGKLSNCRPGESRLEIVFRHRNHGRDDDRTRRNPEQPCRGGQCRDQVWPENVGGDFQDHEHARLHDGNSVKHRGDRRRRHHRARQPAMQRHQRRLRRAEHKQQQKRIARCRIHSARQQSTRRERCGSGGDLHADDARQEQHKRRSDQHCEIDAPGSSRAHIACMRHQRIGREGQHFVENEKREQVRRHRDAHHGEHRQRKAHIEPRLVRLALATHVADREQRVHAPEHARHQREQRAKRLQPESNLQPRHRPRNRPHRRIASANTHEHRDGDHTKHDARNNRQRLTHVRHPADGIDRGSREQWHDKREEDQKLAGAHDAPPSSARAAALASCSGSEASRPNQMFSPARTRSGTSTPTGASRARCAPAGAGRKKIASSMRPT